MHACRTPGVQNAGVHDHRSLFAGVSVPSAAHAIYRSANGKKKEKKEGIRSAQEAMMPMYHVLRKELDVRAPLGSKAGTDRANQKKSICARRVPVERPSARRQSMLKRFMDITKSTVFGRIGAAGDGRSSPKSCIGMLHETSGPR